MDGAATDRLGAGRLAALVVTYNRCDKLRDTLARLLDSPEAELAHLLVVDNASTDDTAAFLAAQEDPRLKVLRLTRNTGGAGGFETGLRQVVADWDPDWVVLMDDDGRPAPGGLAAFHAQDLSGWEAVAAAVYYPGGEICDMNRPSRNPFWHGRVFLRTLLRGGGRGGFHVSPADYQGAPRQIDITSFVGFFISRAGIARAGYPDARYFIYADDGIYALGLSAAGGRIGFLPAVRFEHDCSTFEGQRGRFRPLWKVYYYHRNLLILYRKAAGIWFWPLLFVVVPKWGLKLRDHPGDRGRFLGLLGRALRDGLLRRTGVDHDQVRRWSGD